MTASGARPWWVGEIAVPLALVGLVFVLAVVSVGELMLLIVPLAFGIGWIVAPARLWPIWLGSILLLWLINGLGVLLDLEPDPASTGETVWSFMAESVVFMAVLVLLPLWLGRLAARYTDRRLHQRTT